MRVCVCFRLRKVLATFKVFNIFKLILVSKIRGVCQYNVQSTLVISNLKGPSGILRDIHSSTYQIFRIEETTNRTTKFNK